MVDLSPIQGAAILEGLERAQLDQLAEIAGERECVLGERLFTRGERASTFYVAVRGQYTLTLPVRDFDEHSECAVEEKAALDAFGWSSLVEPRTSLYTAYCTGAGAVVTFPGEELQRLVATDGRLGQRLSFNLNVLIGARVRVVQDLWVEELEHSHERVSYWTHTAMSSRLQRAIE